MRRWLDPIVSSWSGIFTHKLRSFLTILGVVIGVAAVISLMSVGKGAQNSIISSVSSLGANLVVIRPGTTMEGGVRSAFGSASTLTLEDAEAIAAEVPYVTAVAPTISRSYQLVYGSQNLRVQAMGVTPEYQQVNGLTMASGDFISDYDYQRGGRVAVIGSNVRSTLFGEEDPVGQTVRAGTISLRVVGVLQSKGASMTVQADDAIFVPLTALQQVGGQSRNSRGEHIVQSISLTVTDQAHSKAAVEGITTLLLERHQLTSGNADFNIMSMEDILSQVSQITDYLTLLLGAIAGISLLVGGVGVMNIMLVSVIERTREIGIRKALGARERDIWGQFLLEAMFLTFTGGLIGIGVGWGASLIFSRTVMTALVTPDIVILAVSVSVAIGLFFGFYPAWSASRLNPIEALRHE